VEKENEGKDGAEPRRQSATGNLKSCANTRATGGLDERKKERRKERERERGTTGGQEEEGAGRGRPAGRRVVAGRKYISGKRIQADEIT